MKVVLTKNSPAGFQIPIYPDPAETNQPKLLSRYYNKLTSENSDREKHKRHFSSAASHFTNWQSFKKY
jgi:hypothetical protein